MASENASSKSSIVRGKQTDRAGYVMCIDNHDYPASLEIGKVYRRLRSDGQTPNWIRVIDESGEDYLFPAKRFVSLAVPPLGQRALKMAARG
jgi:hypothetical protein